MYIENLSGILPESSSLPDEDKEDYNEASDERKNLLQIIESRGLLESDITASYWAACKVCHIDILRRLANSNDYDADIDHAEMMNKEATGILRKCAYGYLLYCLHFNLHLLLSSSAA
jgi:hypothetical protein